MIKGKIENRTHKDFYLYWLPVIAWGILIFTLSSFSSFPKAVQPLFSFDKLAHAFEYAVFSFLLARAFGNSKRSNFRTYFRALAIICAIVYGLSDELHQYFVPMRTASIIDLLYDSAGAIIGQKFFKPRFWIRRG